MVIWDSHPLALGATPTQVFTDGIPQLDVPHVVFKPEPFQDLPKVPNFDREAEEAVVFEGLPPLLPERTSTNTILFTNVNSVILSRRGDLAEAYSAPGDETGVVVIRDGDITCYGSEAACSLDDLDGGERVRVVDLQGGAISPGLLTYGSPLGLQEIEAEPSTGDGSVFDPLAGRVPKLMGGDIPIVRAVDALQFVGRDSLSVCVVIHKVPANDPLCFRLAYRAGVTKAVVAPVHYGFFGGLGTSFSTGAVHKLADGAVIQEVTALHVSVGHFASRPSISTQIAALRSLLLELTNETPTDVSKPFRDAVKVRQILARRHLYTEFRQGVIPIVVEAHNADVIATLIQLKRDVEKMGAKIHMTIAGATEAHLLVKEIAQANIGIIFKPSRPFPSTWEQRRVWVS